MATPVLINFQVKDTGYSMMLMIIDSFFYRSTSIDHDICWQKNPWITLVLKSDRGKIHSPRTIRPDLKEMFTGA